MGAALRSIQFAVNDPGSSPIVNARSVSAKRLLQVVRWSWASTIILPSLESVVNFQFSIFNLARLRLGVHVAYSGLQLLENEARLHPDGECLRGLWPWRLKQTHPNLLTIFNPDAMGRFVNGTQCAWMVGFVKLKNCGCVDGSHAVFGNEPYRLIRPAPGAVAWKERCLTGVFVCLLSRVL